MEKKVIFLRVLLLIIILSVPAYFIYKDYSAVGGEDVEGEQIVVNASSTPVMGGNKVEETKSVSIKSVATSTPSDKFTLRYSMPDLDKKWVFPADMTAETARIITERVAGINKDLKTDNTQYGKWIDLGTFRKLVGDYDEARNIWEAAAKNWPDGLVSYHNLGDLYHLYLKDYAKAEVNMLKVIELNPQYSSEYTLLHDLYKRLYGSKDARVTNILLEGLEKNPGNVDLMVAVAGSYREAGDITNARKYYEMAIARAKELGNATLQRTLEGEIASLRSQ